MRHCKAGEASKFWHYPKMLLGGESLVYAYCKRGAANVCVHRLAIDPSCGDANPS